MKKTIRFAAERSPVARVLVLALSGIGLISLPVTAAMANPQGGQVVAGNATIRQETPTKVGITQTTDKAIIDWRSFSIGANGQVQFYQPSASAVALNRVVGQDPSQILGRLTANGQVFLVNPNGIYFGKNAQVDVAGLVASTHNIRNEDFLAGKYHFSTPGNPGAAVINEGTIRIADTGVAAFVAPSVANRGVIAAKLGKVTMAAANGFTLDFTGDKLITFLVNDELAQTALDIDGKQLTSFVENSGRIEAQGGYVLLTAKAAENAIHSVINQSGVIEATTVGTHKGEIYLLGGKHGKVEVSGTLDASAPDGGDGGFIETSGQQFSIASSAAVTTMAPRGKTGTWLIDPDNIVVWSGGADGFGSGTSLGLSDNVGSTSTIDPSLLNNASSNVELQAVYNITFPSAVAMTNPGVGLTAKAGADIHVNANISTNGGNINLLAGWDQGSNAAGINPGGVQILAGTVSSGVGNIVITGKRSIFAAAVDIVGSSVIQTTSGNISVTGRTEDWSFGVELLSAAKIKSVDGDISIVGSAFNTHGIAAELKGIYVAGEISVTGSGGLRVEGTAGNNTVLSQGIFVTSSGIIKHTGTPLSGKKFSIIGEAGASTRSSVGVLLVGNALVETFNAPLTIKGVAGGAPTDAVGVLLTSPLAQDITRVLSSGIGSVTLVGQSLGTPGIFQAGISIGPSTDYSDQNSYIQTAGARVNLFADNVTVRNEATFGLAVRGASYKNTRPYSAYAAYAALTPAQSALVQEFQSASAATILTGINAGRLRNDSADPVWSQLYVNGTATQTQIDANNQWNAIQAAAAAQVTADAWAAAQAAEAARLAQLAATEAARIAAANALAAAQAAEAARLAQLAADNAALDKALADAKAAADRAAEEARKAKDAADAAAEQKRLAEFAKQQAEQRVLADANRLALATNDAAVRNATVALNTSKAAVDSITKSLELVSVFAVTASVQADNAEASARLAIISASSIANNNEPVNQSLTAAVNQVFSASGFSKYMGVNGFDATQLTELELKILASDLRKKGVSFGNEEFGSLGKEIAEKNANFSASWKFVLDSALESSDAARTLNGYDMFKMGVHTGFNVATVVADVATLGAASFITKAPKVVGLAKNGRLALETFKLNKNAGKVTKQLEIIEDVLGGAAFKILDLLTNSTLVTADYFNNLESRDKSFADMVKEFGITATDLAASKSVGSLYGSAKLSAGLVMMVIKMHGQIATAAVSVMAVSDPETREAMKEIADGLFELVPVVGGGIAEWNDIHEIAKAIKPEEETAFLNYLTLTSQFREKSDSLFNENLAKKITYLADKNIK
jgi:filamentous hemagglutinin family protein